MSSPFWLRLGNAVGFLFAIAILTRTAFNVPNVCICILGGFCFIMAVVPHEED